MNIIENLKKLSACAKKNEDIPISCIIMKKNKVISKGYNMKNKRKNPILHAEVVAIIKAAKRLKTYNLGECTMYVTLEPCNMCKEIIKESRLKSVYYILPQQKQVNSTTIYKKIETDEINYFADELIKFFKNKR